ncbi:uncharacterized protein BYT42DRAFT_573049 [Radiomyces spectabilis]|uniref:uncharacterized protein n=1 Tax=Radiomyces spectabilis TaxID=64574 RepID=UPI00221E449A|nr:uncharacterized protein BYT42DRAFT_573049 [Radiomyces spectabilis]KAI8375998.1 hypothetical protein BYT42DRAFT_573049 [Radiomyces spectabilis]
MSDLNWCTYCDSAISPFSNSLYCSEDCLRSDALNHHPLLGYDYAELKDFPRSIPTLSSSASSVASDESDEVLSPIMLAYPSSSSSSRIQIPSPPIFELVSSSTTTAPSIVTATGTSTTTTTMKRSAFFI